MPFRALKDVTLRDVNDDGFLHHAGAILSDWQVNDFVKAKVTEGSMHYRGLLEPMTEAEAYAHRKTETSVEGDHFHEGERISAPFEDYVGLHPEEIVDRMKKATDPQVVEHIRKYERGGEHRAGILDYLAPVERQPFWGYDDLQVREILQKMESLTPEAVADVKTYESAHRDRPAIITFEKDEAPAPKRRGRKAEQDGGAEETPESSESTEEVTADA